MKWMCLHCLKEGDWPDDPESICPECRGQGHTGDPWTPGSCVACNADFHRKMVALKAQIDERVQREARMSTSELLAEYTVRLNQGDRRAAEEFFRHHADNHDFVELAQTARNLQEALKTHNPEDA
jgi:hypothetical protein